MGNGLFALADPTARTAFGFPARLAISAYVSVFPKGIFSTSFNAIL